MNTKKHPAKAGLIAGVYFGGFQALMPTLGYICSGTIRQYIEAVSKYVALFLLCMIRENLKGECKGTSRELGFTVMIPAAIATSTDAFAVGITLAALNVKILPSAALIGTTTFLIAFVGVWIGHFFGDRLGNRAGILGGVILVLIGVRIFIMG